MLLQEYWLITLTDLTNLTVDIYHTRHSTHQIFKTIDIYHYSTHDQCPILPIPMFFFTHSVVNVVVVNVIPTTSPTDLTYLTNLSYPTRPDLLDQPNLTQPVPT